LQLASLDSRTPVLVGAAAVVQREPDPALAREPAALMREALERAADDAGSHALLGRADTIHVPRGTWSYPDVGRLLAEGVGTGAVHSHLAQIGVLQTALLGRAVRDVARGRSDVALVVGGEAAQRARNARRSGVEASETPQADARPDEVDVPHGTIVNGSELRARMVSAVSQFAVIENALRAAQREAPADHTRRVAELWADLGRAAAQNPTAWLSTPFSADEIATPGPGNRMLAFPYTKRHCSQMNVDQAAALIVCNVGTARALGVPRERWIFPWTVAESNHMVPLTERRALHRSPGFARAGERALSHGGLDIADVAHLELYSCFPSAVQVQLRELDLAPSRPLSVTGGMAVAGGPFNNFVLQALARMVDVLRADPGSVGMVNAVSGLLTKQGVSLWSSEPAPRPFAWEDVDDTVAAELETVEVYDDARGEGRIASYTVIHDGPQPRTVLVVNLDAGGRTVVSETDPELAERGAHEELCGKSVHLGECAALA
jgi:acetyl-CoA C-acetyltransferase